MKLKLWRDRVLFVIGVVAVSLACVVPIGIWAQTWTAPITWTHGQNVDEIALNAQLRDNLLILKTNINNDGTFKAAGLPAFLIPTEYNAGNSSTAITLNFSTNGPLQLVTRTGSCTVTLTAPTYAGTVIVRFVHEASATAYTVAFSPSVKFPGGTSPTWTNTSGAIDVLTLYWNGTIWIGSMLPNFS